MHIHSWQFHRQGGAANSTKSLLSLHAPNPLKEKIGVSFLAQPAFLSFPDSRHPPDKLLAGVDPVAQCASLGTVSRCTVSRCTVLRRAKPARLNICWSPNNFGLAKRDLAVGRWTRVLRQNADSISVTRKRERRNS